MNTGKMKVLIAAVTVAGGALSAMATAYTWTGAADACWTNKANWNVGSSVATAVPGSASGDTVTFPALAAANPVVINLDGMTQIKGVTFDCGATSYQLGMNDTTNQSLRIEGGVSVSVQSGVTANQKIMAITTVGSQQSTYTFYNNSSTARFIYGSLFTVVDKLPIYNFYGIGDIEMDGTTSFAQVRDIYFYNTGKFILGDKSYSGGNRVRTFISKVASSLAGAYRQIEIPAGRYLNTTDGGWNGLVMTANENTRIYGEGIITARYHYNCNTVASQEFSADFAVAANKELKIESYIRQKKGDMAAWGGPGLLDGSGTLYLCSSNNLPGQARIHTSGTLAVDKIGMKGCQCDESNLGMGDAIRFMSNGTLEYRGTSGETTDRDLIVSNSASLVTMTLANNGGGKLVWTGTAKQSFPASQCVGARLRLNAKTAPIICNGAFEAGKDWTLLITGDRGVMIDKDYGEDLPIRLDGGRLVLTNNIACSSTLYIDSGSEIEICANCAVSISKFPVVAGGSVNFIVPDSASVTFPGRASLRLDNITINGKTAKTDANGKLVEDTSVYETSVWTAVTSGGNWSAAANWLDGRVPNDNDSIVVSNQNDSSPWYNITLDTPATVYGIREQVTKDGSQTFAGSQLLTIGAGGYIAVTNTAVSDEYPTYDKYDGGPFNFYTPLRLSSNQRWLLGSARGQGATDGNSVRKFTNDLSSEPDIEWSVFGYARYRFTGGSSTNFLGTVNLGSFVQFEGTNQFHRLGTNGITLTCTELTDAEAKAAGTTRMSPGLTYAFKPGETNATVVTPIAVNATTTVVTKRSGWSVYDIPICMRVPSTAECGEPLALTLSGGLSGSATCSNVQLTFSQSTDFQYPGGYYAYCYYPEDQKIILTGDGRTLSGNAVRTYTMLELANQNAIGVDNCRGVTCGFDGYWLTQCYDTIQGVALDAGLSMSGSISAHSSSDKDGACNRIAYMQVGSVPSRTDPSAKRATFTGNISETGYNGFRLRLYAAKDTEARFTGQVKTLLPLSHPYGEHPDIIGLGDVILANSGNSFATNVCVRSGRLVLETNGAGGSKPIWLGGFVPTLNEVREVRCVSASAVFDFTLSNETVGGVTKYGRKLVVNKTSVPDIDGVTLKCGDYVLINRPFGTVANGLWRISDDDVKVWRRPEELDEADDLIGKVGLRLKVKEGKRFGGKAFMLSRNPQYYRLSTTQFNESDERFNKSSGVPIFHPEAAADPDAAVLTGADGLTLTCGIDVTDNASSGASIIGSKIENSTSGFSGAIRLAKSVTLAAASGSTVNFTGTISGAGDIVGGGSGISDITGATVAIDSTNGYRLVSGTLRVTAAQLGSRAIAWVRKTSDDGDSTGTLAVTGDLDLSGRTVDLSSFALSRKAGDDMRALRKFALATATGTITLPSVKLPTGWSLTVKNNTLYADYAPLGTIILFR